MDALSSSARERLNRLALDARAEFRRIALWWSRHSVDHDRGGFYGAVGADNAPAPDTDKSVILNTRLLWFFSEAARASANAEATELANRAAAYISEYFFDKIEGGLYWMLDASGRPTDQRKQAYAQAFGVYAFAAHFATTGAKASLQMALSLFETLETHFFDSDRDGYWEARGRAFEAIDDVRLSARDLNAPLTMNTHLHVVEAYTALYAVIPARSVADTLARATRILMQRVYDGGHGHLRLFFDADWRPVDSTISFGHDIEASWLLWEAAQGLGQPDIMAEARRCGLRLAESTFAQAIGPDGEVFEDMDSDGRIRTRRVWWIQAEALVGLLNAFELCGQERFLDAACNVWGFIQRYQIDPEAEWRAASSLDETCTPAPMADAWKCPYHTGRAMIETERRARALLSAGSHSHHLSRD